MEENISVLLRIPLFEQIEPKELEGLLCCLNAEEVACRKGSLVFCTGDPARKVGIVLAGMVQVMRDDFLGNRTILAQLGTGELFGETFACAEVNTLPVAVEAATDARILLVDYRKIVTTCPSSCTFHNRLIQNMLKILANKNLMLNGKIEVLSARTTREKLMTYLTTQAERSRSPAFQIPFSRQELADYLAVDRSALSREMGVMRREGLLRYHKNQFELL